MELGYISTLLVWGAATAFTIGLVAYSVALARVAEASSRAVRDARLARDTAPAAAEHTAAGVVQGVPALSGQAARAAGGTTTAVVTGPGDEGTGPSDPAGLSSTRTAAEQAAADRALLPSSATTGIARSTSILGLALLLGGIVFRGLAAGRWPTANMYEFTLVGSFVAALVLVIVQRRRIIPFLGVLVMGIAVLALVLALNVFYIKAEAVQPALQDYWLIIHVGVAISATGVFTVAFATSVLQVLQDGRESRRSHLTAPWSQADGVRRRLAHWRVTGPAWSWLRTVPSSRNLEALAFRLNAIGFVLWTFTLIGGAIWAEQAWGRYWGWDPKEVGTFVVWVVYAAYLHARTTRGWAGRRAAYLVYVGYTVVILNFTVVNLFINGKHSYSGL